MKPFALMVLFAASIATACSQAGEPIRSVAFYAADTTARDQKLAACKTLTSAERQADKNCAAARAALKDAMGKGYTDRGNPVTVTPLPQL